MFLGVLSVVVKLCICAFLKILFLCTISLFMTPQTTPLVYHIVWFVCKFHARFMLVSCSFHAHQLSNSLSLLTSCDYLFVLIDVVIEVSFSYH